MQCDICGVDDDVMELEDENEEQISEEAIKIGKDDEERMVQIMIDPRRPTKQR